MKSYFVLGVFSLVINWSVATNLERARIAELKQKIDEGIKLHQVMGRELPFWFEEFKEEMIILDQYWRLSDEEICAKREEIRQKIKDLENLVDKIKLAWDLKGEQLVELTEILHHTKYDTTGLRNFTHEEEDCKKPLHDYIQGANTTHIEEDEIIKEYEKYILDNLKKWEEHPCDCVWGEWEEWTDCTKTCGGGTRNRDRKVAEPAINGGQCLGSPIDNEECNVGCCPVDCTWNEWSEWSECPAHCPYCPERPGDGKITRHRSKEEHECGGAPCEGEAEESQDCNIIAILLEKVGKLEKEIDGCRDENDILRKENEDLTKKLCSMLDCQNGGVCEQGACQCKEGYIGSSCEVKHCPSVSGVDFEKTLEFIMIGKTHAEAQKHCENMKGKKLVSVDSAEKAEFINTKIKGNIWWTSGKRMTGNTWSWGPGEPAWPAAKADESDCMYRNWYNGEPNNNGGNENCIEIYAHAGVADKHIGTWNDKNCNAHRPFICEAPDCSMLNCQNGGVCKQGACQCKGGFLGKSCEVAPGNGFIIFDNRNYQFFERTRKTVAEAQADCNARGMKLLSIDSQMEDEFVSNVLKDRIRNSFWTGGYSAPGLSTWTWVPSAESWPGKPTGPNDSRYRNWRIDHPMPSSEERCLYVYYREESSHSKWYAYKCNDTRFYICEEQPLQK